MSGPFKDDENVDYHNCDRCNSDFYEDDWRYTPTVVSDTCDFCENCQGDMFEF